MSRNDDRIRCSFCGKTQNQVRKLIAGPNGAFICDECVDICQEIIMEELDEFGHTVEQGHSTLDKFMDNDDEEEEFEE